jgi:hypothetical protein
MEFEPRLAFEHLDKLAYEIGPRLAGTRGEKLAAQYIRKQLKGYGYEVKAQEFNFVSKAAKMWIRGGLLLVAFVASFFLSAQASFIALLALIPLCYTLPYAMPRRKSQNIIGTIKPKKPERQVTISAHYDSARCTPSPYFNIFLRLAFLPATIAFTICLLARLAGQLPLSWPIIWGMLALICLPTYAGMLIFAGAGRISPGANDNASGVAVILEAARISAKNPPPNVALSFVGFGAEEEGLHGSQAFAARKMVGEKTSILNLEMLGVGKPFVIEGNGILRRTQTPPELNRLLMRCCKRAGLKPKFWWAPLAGHDHVPLVRAGLWATTFTMDVPRKGRLGGFMGGLLGLPNFKRRGYRYIHTPEDVPDKIKLANIERAGRVVVEFIKS